MYAWPSLPQPHARSRERKGIASNVKQRMRTHPNVLGIISPYEAASCPTHGAIQSVRWSPAPAVGLFPLRTSVSVLHAGVPLAIFDTPTLEPDRNAVVPRQVPPSSPMCPVRSVTHVSGPSLPLHFQGMKESDPPRKTPPGGNQGKTRLVVGNFPFGQDCEGHSGVDAFGRNDGTRRTRTEAA